MLTYTDADGNKYEMPELDAGLYAKQEAVDNATGLGEKAKAAWAFLKAVLPADALKAEFGTTDQRRASVPRVLTVYAEAKRLYWEDYEDVQRAETERRIEALGGLPQVIEALAKVDAL